MKGDGDLTKSLEIVTAQIVSWVNGGYIFEGFHIVRLTCLNLESNFEEEVAETSLGSDLNSVRMSFLSK